MSSYEKDQKRLMKLYNEILSDEDEPIEYADNNSSDDFQPSSSSDSDSTISDDSTYKKNPKKRYKRYV